LTLSNWLGFLDLWGPGQTALFREREAFGFCLTAPKKALRSSLAAGNAAKKVMLFSRLF
jgi:hypothetical protein